MCRKQFLSHDTDFHKMAGPLTFTNFLIHRPEEIVQFCLFLLFLVLLCKFVVLFFGKLKQLSSFIITTWYQQVIKEYMSYQPSLSFHNRTKTPTCLADFDPCITVFCTCWINFCCLAPFLFFKPNVLSWKKEQVIITITSIIMRTLMTSTHHVDFRQYHHNNWYDVYFKAAPDVSCQVVIISHCRPFPDMYGQK